MLKISLICNLLLLTLVYCQSANKTYVAWKRPMVKLPSGTKLSVSSVSTQIIGGTVATAGLIPYQAFLYVTAVTGESWYCGGSLIHLKWVLTAAHCVDGASTISVRLGSLLPLSGGTVLTSTVFYKHPAYTDASVNDDIGLVMLPSNAPANANIKVVPILATTSSCTHTTMRTLRVSGWGKTSDASNTISSTLNYVSLTEITDQTCLGIYGADTIVPTIMCTWGNKTRSTCSGDSGGPAVVITSGISYLVGSVSFGAAESCVNYPSGFIETPPYRDWIRAVTGVNTL